MKPLGANSRNRQNSPKPRIWGSAPWRALDRVGHHRAHPFYFSWLCVDLQWRSELQNLENKHISGDLTDRIAIAHLKIALEPEQFGEKASNSRIPNPMGSPL